MMWISRRGGIAGEQRGAAGMGKVTIGGKEPAVRTEGELRKTTVLSPAGYYWAPRAGDEAMVLQAGDLGEDACLVGSVSDYPWIPAAYGEKGTVTYTSYKDINGQDQFLGVYLPPNYSCYEEYPVIYVSHGGGGNEADWFSQGGIANIMDNLIAQRKTQEAILVTMNNSVYKWDFEVIAQNLIQCVMPFVCRTFAASRDPELNAFCGLSMGSMTTLYMYMHHTECWQYYGAFSGGIAGGEHFSLENPHLMDVSLLIGCAEEDIAYNEREIGVPPTIRALQAKGIPHETYFTTASHDWFCWPQMFAYFAENTLWK